MAVLVWLRAFNSSTWPSRTSTRDDRRGLEIKAQPAGYVTEGISCRSDACASIFVQADMTAHGGSILWGLGRRKGENNSAGRCSRRDALRRCTGLCKMTRGISPFLMQPLLPKPTRACSELPVSCVERNGGRGRDRTYDDSIKSLNLSFARRRTETHGNAISHSLQVNCILYRP